MGRLPRALITACVALLIVACAPSKDPSRPQRPEQQSAEAFADELVRVDPDARGVEIELEVELPEAVALDPPRCVGEPFTPRERSPELSCCYIPPSVFTSVVAKHFDGLRDCYDAARGRDDSAAGQVVSRFSIAGDGSVPEVCVVATAIQDDVFVRCVAERFRAMRWPARFGDDPCGDPTVSYPLTFVPKRRAE